VVFLNPGAAQGFALVLHELATNAAKHGSLSAAGGTVEAHSRMKSAVGQKLTSQRRDALSAKCH